MGSYITLTGGGTSVISSPIDTSLLVQPAAWYDFSDSTTLFVNSDGTGGMPAANAGFGLCEDKSGNNNHLFQAADTKPKYKLAALNGLSGALFDGVDDYLRSDIIASWVRPQTVFMVMGQVANISGDRIMDGYYLNTAAFYQDGGKEATMYGGSTGAVSSGMTVGKFDIIVLSFFADSTFANVLRGIKTASAATQAGDMTGITLGTGGVGGAVGFANITFTEVLVYNSFVPAITQEQIIDYLSNKYNI